MSTYRVEVQAEGREDLFFCNEAGMLLDHQKVSVPIPITELDSIVWHGIVDIPEGCSSLEFDGRSYDGHEYHIRIERTEEAVLV